MAGELGYVGLVIKANGRGGVSQQGPDLGMMGIADNHDLTAVLVQLLNDVLSASDQDASAVNDFQAATLGIGKNLGTFAVRTN